MASGRGAKGGSPRGKRPTGRRSGSPPGSKKPSPGTRSERGRTSASREGREPTPASEPPQPASLFRLGAVPGATPGTWIATWRERMPGVPLELVPIAVAEQRDELVTASVDAALVRLPIERTGLHVIALYEEVPVVVCGADSHLTAADELTIDDLAGEIVVVPRDAVLNVDVPGAVATAFDPPETTEDAIAIAATGIGVVIVPLSLARLHHRRDVRHRRLIGGPGSSVALAWPADATTALVETFVGIVRGRTARSSRD